MKHLFFFKSSNPKDGLSTLTILTSSARKAYALAVKHFINNGYKGCPITISL